MKVAMRHIGPRVVAVVFTLLFAWESFGSIGPFGGTVDFVVVDPANPDVIYASARGLFKTTDQGEAWSETSLGEAVRAFDVRPDVLAVAIDPLNPNVLYAGVSQLGLFKSTNGGEEWLVAGLRDQALHALAIDPNDPRIVYAASDDAGIFKSTDAGASWTQINRGLTIRSFLSLAIDPANPATVYAGSNYTFPASIDGRRQGFGVFKTTNGGQEWIATGLTNEVVYSIAIDPLNANRIYVAVGDPNEIDQTLDGGEHWTIRRDGVIQLDVECVAFDTVAPDTLYACTKGGGVHRTIDAGGLWLPTALNRGVIKSVVVTESASHAVLAGAAVEQGQGVLGVYKSLDGGQSWGQFNHGISRREITSIVVRPDDPNFIYVAAEGRVFRTLSGGAEWVPLGADLPFAIRLLAFDPANPNILYGVGGTIYRSEDRGEHWEERRQGIGTDVGYISALAIDPTDSNKLYIGTFFRGVFKTSDGGNLWQRSGSPWQIGALRVDPGNPPTLYVGLSSGVIGQYALKSVNAGETWFSVSSGLPTWGIGDMLVDPTDSQIAYVAYERPGHGIFKTVSGGGNWEATGLTTGSVYAMVFHPGDSTTIYAGTQSGLRRSTDGGLSWNALGPQIAHQQISAIVVHPLEPRRLYVATAQSAFASDDGGETWF